MKLVALIAAHNEEETIRSTLLSLKAQERKLDRIVVAVDNCTDNTLAQVQSVPGVIAFETVNNKARKSGALNQAWLRYCQDAHLIVCVDADTLLDTTAVGDWEFEFMDNPQLGGCSAKFTMLVSPEMRPWERLLVRLQRAEFAKWTDMALRRGRKTSVLAGTACCISNRALFDVVCHRLYHGDPAGPWTEVSVVEDFELTHRMRLLGWETKVSASVRAYTDAMTSLRALWSQRMKWQTGTVNDLLEFGLNRYTWLDWWQQAQGLIAIVVRLTWIAVLALTIAFGQFHLHPLWLIPPVIFFANDVKQAFRIPRRDKFDILVASLMLPQELFAFMRAAWFGVAWTRVLNQKIFGVSYANPWARQAQAETTRRTTAPAAA